MIIFLDIDGVLVHNKCKNVHTFDPLCVKVLKKLINYYNAKIVISSSWRIYHLELALDQFELNGLDLDIIIGKTPIDKIDGNRFNEISTWINDCINLKTPLNIPNLDEFLIIDDDFRDTSKHPWLTGSLIFIDNGWCNGGLKMKHIKKYIL
jgi:hypothetical protein